MEHTNADALMRALEDGPAGAEGGQPVHALIRFGQALRDQTPGPDPAFKAELRAMLVEEARGQAAALPRLLPRVRSRAQTAVERLRWSTRTASAGMAAAVALSSGGGVAVAAERALPNQPLYSVKVALDEARAALAFGPVREGERHLANAEERVEDAEHAFAAGDSAGAGHALELSAGSARKGASALIRGYQERGDRDLVQRLSLFAAMQRPRVAALAARLDGEAAEAARASLVVLDRIEQRLVAIGGTCAGCVAEEPPRSGGGFDFAEIPPPDEPFQPCPCDDGEPPRRDGGGTSRPPADDPRPEPSPTPSPDPSEQPEPPRQGPVPELPPPGEDVDDVVNDVVRDVVDGEQTDEDPAEEGQGEQIPVGLPKGGLALPEEAPSLPATPEAPALPATPEEPALPETPALPEL